MQYLKENKVWVSIVVILIVLVGVFGFKSNNNKNEIETVSPESKTLTEIVKVTGKVVPAERADLAFEKAGIVNTINVNVGSQVKKGEVLATLSSNDLYAQLQEAQANLQAQIANYNDVKDGATDAEIAVKEQALNGALADLTTVNGQIQDTLVNVQTGIKDILEYKLATIMVKDGTGYKAQYTTCDDNAKINSQYNRPQLDNYKMILAQDLTQAWSTLTEVSVYTEELSRQLSLPCAALDQNNNTYRTTISGIRTQINALITEINTRKSQLTTANNNVARAQKDLDLIKSGADTNRIKLAQAQVSQAEARVNQVKASIAKNILVAPFDGVITAKNIEVGELASISSPSFSIINNNLMQAEANIAEIDFSKVAVGNNATITLDAYGNDVEFPATIIRLDPSAVLSGGVPTYKATLSFLNSDERIKDGMTANLNIVTNVKKDALAVPAKFIQLKTGGGLVKVKTSSGTEERIVTVGIRGVDGDVEITSGVKTSDVLEAIVLDKDTLKSAK